MKKAIIILLVLFCMTSVFATSFAGGTAIKIDDYYGFTVDSGVSTDKCLMSIGLGYLFTEEQEVTNIVATGGMLFYPSNNIVFGFHGSCCNGNMGLNLDLGYKIKNVIVTGYCGYDICKLQKELLYKDYILSHLLYGVSLKCLF